ncbi:Multidrug resistance protein MdtA precursor [Botrimarina colliarenosi]|uniref:Multidrug resistance protein MdtA n=1 Tax=Botrimarina colliarenosi TaxID=2528001 RepID=A0A5C6ACS7_9BACT|nr:efflux RND transporter periplasmic adaptor subunit [Botrimarina colliarenosi]TWT97764.1 Multidrug resistance protein MdtA precursor [Botrimarina colliarenosi]
MKLVQAPLQSLRRSLFTISSVALLTSLSVAQPPGAPPPAVIVAEVTEQTVAASQQFVGTVEPLRRATIGSAVDGRVVQFPVNEGDRVEAGQTLAQLLTDTITLELLAAKGELELRRQRLALLKNGSLPAEVAQSRARMAATDARREFARARRDRTERVYRDQGVISDDEREEMIATAAEAEQAFLEAEAAHQLAIDGPRIELIAQAQAEVAIQEAVVERLSDQIAKHTIISRFAGYVVAEHTEEGQWVNRGDAVADVVAVDQVYIVAQVVEQSIPFITPGTEVTVEIPSVRDRLFEGRVSEIIPQGDARSRTFPVKIVVNNEISAAGPLLKPGMYARVSLPVGAEQRATLAPKDAVVLGGNRPVVFVVDGAAAAGSQGTVRPVPVELGVAVGTLIQLKGDLKPGQIVVVEGNERLRPGQPVRVGRVAEPSAG